MEKLLNMILLKCLKQALEITEKFCVEENLDLVTNLLIEMKQGTI